MKKIIKLKEKDLHKIVKRVISEENMYPDNTPETNLQEKGMTNPTECKFIIKKWKKRNGETIRKAFIKYKFDTPGGIGGSTTHHKLLPLCETMVGVDHEIMFDNVFIPDNIHGDEEYLVYGDNPIRVNFHTGDPREECIELSDINYVSLSEYRNLNPPIEPEDNWWDNEIADDNENIDG